MVPPNDDVELCTALGALLTGTVWHPVPLQIVSGVLLEREGGEGRVRERGEREEKGGDREE